MAWVPDVEFFGADYAFVISPTWGYARTQIRVKADANCVVSVGSISRSITAGDSVDILEQNTGLGDLYVQPLWLAWRNKHYDVGLSYGFYAPTGYYNKDSIANVGLGFWT